MAEWERANEAEKRLQGAFDKVLGHYELCKERATNRPENPYWFGVQWGLRMCLEILDEQRWKDEVLLGEIEESLERLMVEQADSESAPAGLGPDFGLGPGR